MTYTNPNYYKVLQAFKNQIEDLEKPRILYFKVDSNPFGDGESQEIGFYLISRDVISSYLFGQDDIDNIDYAFTPNWQIAYTGDFVLCEPTPTNKKPTLYKVGDWVDFVLRESTPTNK